MSVTLTSCCVSTRAIAARTCGRQRCGIARDRPHDEEDVVDGDASERIVDLRRLLELVGAALGIRRDPDDLARARRVHGLLRLPRLHGAPDGRAALQTPLDERFVHDADGHAARRGPARRTRGRPRSAARACESTPGSRPACPASAAPRARRRARRRRRRTAGRRSIFPSGKALVHAALARPGIASSSSSMAP